MIVGLPIQFGQEFGPIGGRCNVGFGLSAPRRAADYVNECDGKMTLSEGARQAGDPIGNFRGNVRGRHRDDAFLHVDHDQGGDRIELGKCHRYVFH